MWETIQKLLQDNSQLLTNVACTIFGGVSVFTYTQWAAKRGKVSITSETIAWYLKDAFIGYHASFVATNYRGCPVTVRAVAAEFYTSKPPFYSRRMQPILVDSIGLKTNIQNEKGDCRLPVTIPPQSFLPLNVCGLASVRGAQTPFPPLANINKLWVRFTFRLAPNRTIYVWHQAVRLDQLEPIINASIRLEP